MYPMILRNLLSGLSSDVRVEDCFAYRHVAMAVVSATFDIEDGYEERRYTVIHNQDFNDIPRSERAYTWDKDYFAVRAHAEAMLAGLTLSPLEIEARRQCKKALDTLQTKLKKQGKAWSPFASEAVYAEYFPRTFGLYDPDEDHEGQIDITRASEDHTADLAWSY